MWGFFQNIWRENSFFSSIDKKIKRSKLTVAVHMKNRSLVNEASPSPKDRQHQCSSSELKIVLGMIKGIGRHSMNRISIKNTVVRVRLGSRQFAVAVLLWWWDQENRPQRQWLSRACDALGFVDVSWIDFSCKYMYLLLFQKYE